MIRNVGIVTGVCLASIVLSGRADAQPGPYPAPPGGGYPQPAPPGAAPYGPAPAPTQPAPPAPEAPGGPPGAAPGYGQPGAPAYGQPGAPAYGQPGAPAYGQPGAPAPGGPGASASAGGSFSTGGGLGFDARGPSIGPADAETEDTGEDEEEDDFAYRKDSLRIQNSLDGSTGLLRTQFAGSGAPGTFRFSLITSYFAGSGFLCPKCESLDSSGNPDGGVATRADEARHIGGHVGISATFASFLEGYLGVHTTASTNTLGNPELLQVLGDTNLGLKAFMPRTPDGVFSAGGGLDLWLLNGTGAVGIDTASYGLRGLITADFNNRAKKEDRIPLRTHLNLGYTFDNSGNLVESVENRQRGGRRITRVERFGLGINRVDRARLALGVEGVFDIVRPFIEWTADVPVNRQEHVCDLQTRSTDDLCLGQAAGFSTTPSRLTLGTRLHPFLDGLAFLAAFDIGTGATSDFIEEVTPEMPWNFYVGLAYAVDTKPQVEVKRVEVTKVVRGDVRSPPRFIQGLVVDKALGTPVPDAVVRFEGRSMTGMVTMADGTFRTSDLEPGTYTFAVSAPGYRDAQCGATIGFAQAGPGGAPYGGAPAGAPFGAYGTGLPPQGGMGAPPMGQPGQPAPYSPQGAPPPYGATPPPVPGQTGGAGMPAATVTCEVESLPKVGNVNGRLRDAESSAAVGGASVKITDKLGRSLSLTADGGGAFRFENVPSGAVTISADADGYLRSVLEIEVKPRTDVTAEVALTKRPKKPNVVVTDKELKLKKAVHFLHDSAVIQPDSMGIVEEIADVLRSHAEITAVEIQGHTDDSGTPAYNLRLSADRANAVREALTLNGVEPGRLTSRGYGQEKPLVPNTNEANRARNRRVQLMIQK